MVELIKQHQHFLRLFVQTTGTQRKGLLRTITKNQLRVLSQVTHNVIKANIKLGSSDKKSLKRYSHVVHILGNKRAGYRRKKDAIVDKQRLVQKLIQLALKYLDPLLV